MPRVLSWALNDVFELSWWYSAESSFRISATGESATVEVLKSLILSQLLSPLFPLNIYIYIYIYIFNSELKKKKKEAKIASF